MEVLFFADKNNITTFLIIALVVQENSKFGKYEQLIETIFR